MLRRAKEACKNQVEGGALVEGDTSEHNTSFSGHSTISTSYDLLTSWTEELLSICDVLAEINRIRLRDLKVGEKVPRLPSPQFETICDCIDHAISVAVKMLSIVTENKQDLESIETDTRPSYKVYLSYSSKESVLYEPVLRDAIQNSELEMTVHHPADHVGWYRYNTISIQEALLSDCLVCVCCYQALQSKWPLAELVCGMARATCEEKPQRSPLLVDAMPGMQWLQSELGRQKRATSWTWDILALFPRLRNTYLLSMEGSNAHGEFGGVALPFASSNITALNQNTSRRSSSRYKLL